MVDDHSKANDQLKALASQESVTLPTSLSAKDQALVNRLQNMKGTAFDKAYMRDMVKDHEEDIEEFQPKKPSAARMAKEARALEPYPVSNGSRP